MKWNSENWEKIGIEPLLQKYMEVGYCCHKNARKRFKRLLRFEINQLKYKITDLSWNQWCLNYKYKELKKFYTVSVIKFKLDGMRELKRGIEYFVDDLRRLEKEIKTNKARQTMLHKSLAFLEDHLTKINKRLK